MKRFRKMIAVVLAVTMAAPLGAYEDDGTASSSAAASIADPAEGGKMINIGVAQLLTHPAVDAFLKGFKDGLASQGFGGGEGATYDIQNVQGEQSNYITIANTFANKRPDLILTIATPTAQAMAKVATDTPMMIMVVTDPADAKLVASNEKPGGNVPGTSDKAPVREQIETLREIMSDIQTVGTMYTSSEINSQLQAKWAKAACEELGLKYQESTISNTDRIQQTAQSVAGKVQAIYIPTGNTLASGTKNVAAVTNSAKLLLIVTGVGPVQSGGLCTVGINYGKFGYQADLVTVRVLRGEVEPADMAIKYQTEYTTSYNSTVVKRLGIAPPERILKGGGAVAAK